MTFYQKTRSWKAWIQPNTSLLTSPLTYRTESASLWSESLLVSCAKHHGKRGTGSCKSTSPDQEGDSPLPCL
uniref:Uncharacterized protein n=1 Tax=Anguilla anguilla TaxID=7936 RepID=A0A0E9R902_ANGAN